MRGFPVRFIIILFILAGTVWLQIFLSKKKEKLLGFILPIITFLFSLDRVYGVIRTIMSHGTSHSNVFNAEIVWDILLVFFILNIPTIVFILIYIRCRKSVNRSRELEKMNIQDLD